MLKRVSAALDVFRKGKAVANPAIWKSRAKLANAIVLLLAALVGTAKVFGFDVPVSGETLDTLGAGLACIFIAVWRMYVTATRTDKGLPAKRQPNSTR